MRHRFCATPNKSTTDSPFVEIKEIQQTDIKSPHITQNVQTRKVSISSETHSISALILILFFFHFFPAAPPTGPTTRSSMTPPRSPRNKSRRTKMAQRPLFHTASTMRARRSRSPAGSRPPWWGSTSTRKSRSGGRGPSSGSRRATRPVPRSTPPPSVRTSSSDPVWRPRLNRYPSNRARRFPIPFSLQQHLNAGVEF